MGYTNSPIHKEVGEMPIINEINNSPEDFEKSHSMKEIKKEI